MTQGTPGQTCRPLADLALTLLEPQVGIAALDQMAVVGAPHEHPELDAEQFGRLDRRSILALRVAPAFSSCSISGTAVRSSAKR